MDDKKAGMTVLKETLILTVITLLSGLLLGFVYEQTKEPIRQQQERAVQDACRAVFPKANGVSFEPMRYFPSEGLRNELLASGVKIGTIYEAKQGEDKIGYVVESTSSEGYGGNIVLYVGVTADGLLNEVSILSISETPGLGMQAEKVLLPQMSEKLVSQIRYTKSGKEAEEEIDAISGATITTKAVTNAVNGALRTIQELGGGDE